LKVVTKAFTKVIGVAPAQRGTFNRRGETKIMNSILKTSAFAIALMATSAASAATFNFEAAGVTSGGGLTTYSETDSGLTMTLTRETGTAFDINALSGAPPSFGARSLSPFVSTVATQFIANFSAAVNNFSFDFGDYGPSDEDLAVANFYSGAGGTGTLLGTTSVSWLATDSFPAFKTLSFSSTSAFLSVKFIGGSTAFPNSVFYDNFTASAVAAVPEPATWAMMLFGFGLVGSALRSRRRTMALA
jgi:PEP-CTERM motif